MNKNLKLKIERLSPAAKLPRRAHATDAGLDLFSADYYSLMPNEKTLISTGVKMAIPDGCVGLIWDKSSMAKSGVHCTAGVIDSGYRGEILISMINLSQNIIHIAPGQKVAQILIQPVELLTVIEEGVDKNTKRGEDSFGSTGLY